MLSDIGRHPAMDQSFVIAFISLLVSVIQLTKITKPLKALKVNICFSQRLNGNTFYPSKKLFKNDVTKLESLWSSLLQTWQFWYSSCGDIPHLLTTPYHPVWGFPESWGYPKSCKSLDHDLVLKQPWWLRNSPLWTYIINIYRYIIN